MYLITIPYNQLYLIEKYVDTWNDASTEISYGNYPTIPKPNPLIITCSILDKNIDKVNSIINRSENKIKFASQRQEFREFLNKLNKK